MVILEPQNLPLQIRKLKNARGETIFANLFRKHICEVIYTDRRRMSPPRTQQIRHAVIDNRHHKSFCPRTDGFNLTNILSDFNKGMMHNILCILRMVQTRKGHMIH